MTLIVEGTAIANLDDFYRLFAAYPSVPEYFGHNLDALEDILRKKLGPEQVVWKDVDCSRSAMGGDFERLADLLREYTASEFFNAHEWKLTFSR